MTYLQLRWKCVVFLFLVILWTIRVIKIQQIAVVVLQKPVELWITVFKPWELVFVLRYFALLCETPLFKKNNKKAEFWIVPIANGS